MPEDTIQNLEQQNPDPSSYGNTKPSNSSLKSIWIVIPLLLVIFGGFIYYYLSYFVEQNDEPSTTDDTYLEQLVTDGKLIIGTDATYPPMEFTTDDDKLVGYDIDLAGKIADEIGVEVEIKNIAWDDLFSALEDSSIDIIISSVTITDERKEIYDFTIPYLNAGQVIITNKSNNSIASTDDLAGKLIGVQEGTTNYEQALLYTEVTNVVAYTDFMEATEALVNGEVDAIFSDLPNAKSITSEYDALKIASDPFTSEQYGIVVKKGKSDFVSNLNDTINSLRQKGYLELLKQKWLE